MGAGDDKRKLGANEKLVSVRTSDLKERLNRLYKGMRGSSARKTDSGRFDYLWDLKELALMEGRSSVDVPETWLEEIENGLGDSNIRHGH
ncbi:MAG: hypothetical protein K2X27_04430 [Candidatus Obscuribacterales bacterium]|nr:hypothetical protein [Candidatus Obscuribacterales bacterium]